MAPSMNKSDLATELRRRMELWSQLKNRGGPDGVSPQIVKALKIHRGQQGIYRDLRTTEGLAETGVTIGLLHTGSVYTDELHDDGLIYYYPSTGRGSRDINEVLATKACGDLELPIFVVIPSRLTARMRDVRLGWVTDYDDSSEQILILFSESLLHLKHASESQIEEEAFVLQVPRRRGEGHARTRPGQTRFRFEGAQAVRC